MTGVQTCALPICLTGEEVATLKGRNDNMTELLPAEDELRLRFDFEAPESEWAWVQPAALKAIPEYDVEKYPAAVIGAAIAKIAENVPEIRFKRSHGVRKWFIPPAIQNTDRFRNAE